MSSGSKHVRPAPGAAQRVEFDLLRPRVGSRLQVRPAQLSEAPAVLRLARGLMPGGVSSSLLARKAVRRNRHNLYLFIDESGIVGFWAMLMLTRRGLGCLLRGELDYANPDPRLLTQTALVPAAIYNWAVVAPGAAAEGILHMSRVLAAPQFRHADLYAKPITAEAQRLQRNRGYRPLDGHPHGLYRYVRLANRHNSGDLPAPSGHPQSTAALRSHTR
jgi:hypothetical protein